MYLQIVQNLHPIWFGEDSLEDNNENDDFWIFDSALEITPDSIMQSNAPIEKSNRQLLNNLLHQKHLQ